MYIIKLESEVKVSHPFTKKVYTYSLWYINL